MTQDSATESPDIQVVSEDVATNTNDNIPTKLSDLDKMALDLAGQKRATILAEAKLAVSKGETAELAFRYTILELYRKYNLSNNDAFNENGDIIYGANKKA
jgi:hypothetical protein